MRALATSLFVALLGTVGCAPQDTAASGRILQVWSGEDLDFLTGDISPDGRYLSDINWDSGDLELVDLEGGQARRVTAEGYAGGYAWTSAFSTDGQRLAVAWYVDQARSYGLRVMNLDGTASRVLVPASEHLTFVDPVDWSPSDEQILVAVRRTDLVWQLGLVSVDDGSMRILKTLSWLAPGGEQTYPRAYFSPDGNYVAYDYPPDLEERARDIYALAVDGSRETKLVSGPATNRLLGWLPDGRGILFFSDRTGTPGIFRLSVRGGRPVGEPELVRADVPGLFPLGFTRNGYAYGVTVESPQVHTAVVDPKAGRVLEPPQRVDDVPSRRSLSADWSPDGRYLAYVTFDPRPKSVETLVIRSVDGKVIRTIPLSPTIHTSSSNFKWVDDNTIILFGMERGRNGIHRMDARDGSFTRLPTRVTDEALNLKFFDVGPKARTLYLVLPPKVKGGPSDIVARDLDTGEQRVIATSDTDSRTVSVSPDGEQLAYASRDKAAGLFELRVSATSGTGEARTLHRSSPGESMSSPVVWTPDGSRVLFGLKLAKGGRALWSVAADGAGPPVRLGGGDWWLWGGQYISIHPDGRRIAVVTGYDRGEIWMLKDF